MLFTRWPRLLRLHDAGGLVAIWAAVLQLTARVHTSCDKVVFFSDGRTITIASVATTVKLWNATSLRSEVTFTRDAKVVAADPMAGLYEIREAANAEG